MKVNIYTSSLGGVSAEQMLKTLSARDTKTNHIVITPDRCTLNWEQKIFDILGVDSLFDVNVMTLTRLTRKVLSDRGLTPKVLTMQGGVSIVQKILLENRKQLVSFGKACVYKNFCRNLFQTIAQFKSCHIVPDDIVTNTGSVALNNKMQDIKLVYSEYEKYLQSEYTDSFNQLNLLTTLIDTSMSNTHFYFVGFDDFTTQAYGIISALIKHSASVNIATTYGVANNKNIYLNNVYAYIMQISQMLGVTPNVVKVPCGLSAPKQYIANNAFGYALSNGDISSYMQVYSYDTIRDEIVHTISDIKLKVINGAKYDEFAIILPQFDTYEQLLIDTCDLFDVRYFMDKSKHLIDVSSFQFVSNLINLPINCNRNNLLQVLKSEYMQLDPVAVNDYHSLVIAKGINYKALFNCECAFADVLTTLMEYCKTDKVTIVSHLDKLKTLLINLHFADNVLSVQNTYLDTDVIEYRTLDQTQTKLAKIFDELSMIMPDYECDYATFVSIFSAYLDNTPIALPPITSAVFVGDQVSSSYADKKYVYMLGVNEGSVPAYNLDLGLISDDDIARLPHQLNPTIAFVNKKNKFKVFENLFCATDKLVVSYVNQSTSGEPMYASAFLVNLATMGGVNIINGSAECDAINANYKALNYDNVIFNNFNLPSAKHNFVQLLKNVNSASTASTLTLAGTLNSAVKGDKYVDNLTYTNVKRPLKSHELYFANGKSSISQIQTYYKCPYKHYATYGLKLQEVPTDVLRPVDYGNIIHKFLEVAVPLLKVDSDVVTLAKEQLDKVLATDYEPILNNKKNVYDIRALHSECVRILKALQHQLSVSLFKPKYFEYGFGGNTGIQVTVNDKKVVFGGIIDRVDVYDDYYRIIDYKTGSDQFKDYGEIELGTRLQLFVYLKAFGDSHKLKPAGAFYLPIVNTTTKGQAYDMYKLKGILLDQLHTIVAMDSALSEPSAKSSVIAVKTTANGTLDKSSSDMRISEEDMQALTQYVFNMLSLAVERIEAGDIVPTPVQIDGRTECDYCPYKGMCNFNTLYGNTYREKRKVQNIKELLGDTNGAN